MKKKIKREKKEIGIVSRIENLMNIIEKEKFNGNKKKNKGIDGKDSIGECGIIGEFGWIKEVRENVEKEKINGRRMGILIIVDKVIVDRKVNKIVEVIIIKCMKEGRKIMKGIKIEKKLVMNNMVKRVRMNLILEKKKRRRNLM